MPHPITWRILLLLLLSVPVLPLDIEEIEDETPDVILSRGAYVEELAEIEVYSELEYIFFLIPDVPDPPPLTNITCSDGVDKKICDMFHDLKKAMKDVKDEMTVINRVLTTKGLGERTTFTPTNLKAKWFDVVKSVDVHSDSPTLEVQEAAGLDYLSEIEVKLALRKLLGIENTNLTKREKRGIGKFIKPIANIVSQIVSGTDLSKLFHGIFTGDQGILKTLAAFRAASSEDRKSFTELSSKVSEFETETRKLFVDVLRQTDKIEEVLHELQNDHYAFTGSVAGFKELTFAHQSLLSDVLRYLYITNVYTMHFQAFSSCRAKMISPVFVPESLLADRLNELEMNMPFGKELVFSTSEVARYYRLTTSSCIFDSNGGLIKIGVPLKEKTAAYQVFQYRPLQFAFNEYTCSLDTQATFVIKDKNSNEVFPITDLELETCQISSGMCLLPYASDLDTSSVCISILFKGSPTDLIKENCPMRCSKRRQTEISKVSEDVFIGTHLPQNGITIKCPDETVNYQATVPYGSTQISLHCTECKIYWNDRVVGVPSGTPCKDIGRPKVQVLLPLQFTILKDLKPVGEGSKDNTVFSDVAEIINEFFDPESEFGFTDVDEGPVIMNSANAIWNLLQSILIVFIMYRNHYVNGAVLAATQQMIRAANASKGHTCKLPADAYIMLWVILLVSMISLLSGLLIKFVRFLTAQWNRTVDLAVTKRQLEEINLD